MARYFKIAENSWARYANLSRTEFLAALKNSKLATERWNTFEMLVKTARQQNSCAGAKTIDAVHAVFDICKLTGKKELTIRDIWQIGDYLNFSKYFEHGWSDWSYVSIKNSVRNLRKRGTVESLFWIYTKEDNRYLSREMSYGIVPTFVTFDPKPSKTAKKTSKNKKTKSAAHTLTLTLALDDEQFSAVMDFLKNKKLL
jgi:hypothetical protein